MSLNTQTEKRTGAGTGQTTLVARGLKKSYADFEAVKGVDFEVHRGSASGFWGQTGPARPRR